MFPLSRYQASASCDAISFPIPSGSTNLQRLTQAETNEAQHVLARVPPKFTDVLSFTNVPEAMLDEALLVCVLPL
jgi:hypothetical protein